MQLFETLENVQSCFSINFEVAPKLVFPIMPALWRED